MHKKALILITALGGVFCPLAAQAWDRLDAAEAQLTTVYWRVYHNLDRPNQLRLKASELDWISWKDNLGRADRYWAVIARINWLESL